MKKFFTLVCMICILLFSGCGSNTEEAVTLSFKNTNSNEYINRLNGKSVSITGYLSIASPLNGEFAYLMNMPYQNCPYCIPGTSEITNTLTIIPKENEKIEMTDLPVTVVGTLEIGEFSDEFGYEYGVRLKDVTVNEADIDKLSENVKKYNILAESGVVSDIYMSIMIADEAVFYDYYELEKPEKISLDEINATKSSLEEYNTSGDYDVLERMMDSLISLCNTVNNDIDMGDYSKFTDYQLQLENLFYSFSDWMAEGEL